LQSSGIIKYELLIAGKGTQEIELKSHAEGRGLERVQFLGHIDSVPELFGSADIVVIPSIWFEAFGLVAAEAMACGAACLVSDAGALPEVVGDCGRVFPAGDDESLSLRLRELIDDPVERQRLGTAGRSRVERMFTLKHSVEAKVKVCEEILGGK